MAAIEHFIVVESFEGAVVNLNVCFADAAEVIDET